MLERNDEELPDAQREMGIVTALANRKRELAITAIVAVTIGGIWWWALQVPMWDSWTGIQGKTLWDLLALLVVPLALLGLGVWFNWSEKKREQQVAEETRKEERRLAKEAQKEEREIALDNQQERALQDYYAGMKDLLLNHKLRMPETGSEVRALAHAQTHTVLRRLDGERRGSVVRFLYDAGLVNGEEPIIPLSGASLQGANLESSGLSGVNLRGALLVESIFVLANLSEALLDAADLRRTLLIHANLTEASLNHTNLNCANLTGASFTQARLVEANLEGANLFGADLGAANLRGVRLIKANLNRANFKGANLDSANLGGADIGTANIDNVDLRGVNLFGTDLEFLQEVRPDQGLEIKDEKIVPSEGRDD